MNMSVNNIPTNIFTLGIAVSDIKLNIIDIMNAITTIFIIHL